MALVLNWGRCCSGWPFTFKCTEVALYSTAHESPETSGAFYAKLLGREWPTSFLISLPQ